MVKAQGNHHHPREFGLDHVTCRLMTTAQPSISPHLPRLSSGLVLVMCLSTVQLSYMICNRE
jgi:hypothetical protein